MPLARDRGARSSRRRAPTKRARWPGTTPDPRSSSVGGAAGWGGSSADEGTRRRNRLRAPWTIPSLLGVVPAEHHSERLLGVLKHELVGRRRVLEQDSVRDQRADNQLLAGQIGGKLVVVLVVPAAREDDGRPHDVGRVEIEADRVGVIALQQDPALTAD